jgi:cytochrome c peroxidase
MIRCVFLIAILIFQACHSPEQHSRPVDEVQNYLNQKIDSLHYFADQLRLNVLENDIPSAKKNFVNSRYQYKKIESIVEFYFPGVAKTINGPAIDKAEEYDDKVIEASGFQVVEEQLFSTETDTVSLLKEIDILRSTLIRIEKLIESNQLSDSNIMEASRLQIVRILSLGISGFDSPVALNSLQEAFHALDGIKSILSFYNSDRVGLAYAKLSKEFQHSLFYLNDHQDFDSFDRASFITDCLNPLSASIQQYQKALEIPNNKWIGAVNMDKENIFVTGALNVSFFAPPHNQEEKTEIINLGKMLFFDPILSGNNSRSCASCHSPSNAFTDGKSKAIAFDFKGAVSRNKPTLINSGFQKSQFWDQRVQFLEDQITDVISNPMEMHEDIRHAVEKIGSSVEYLDLFRSAFGDGDPVTPRNIQASLAWYIRSLQGVNSRFDEYMRGDKSRLSTDEIHGLNLFMGKGKCGTCHFIPLFNGSVPPMYSETESEVLGVPARPDTAYAVVDTDLGKFHTYNRELHKNAFKTPTVRNASLTNPYMHNGVYQTLEEVMDFYNRGGGSGIGIDLSNQTIPFDNLNLSRDEQRNIISFLNALTDTTGLTQIPKALPKINDRRLAKRKVGGEY